MHRDNNDGQFIAGDRRRKYKPHEVQGQSCPPVQGTRSNFWKGLCFHSLWSLLSGDETGRQILESSTPLRWSFLWIKSVLNSCLFIAFVVTETWTFWYLEVIHFLLWVLLSPKADFVHGKTQINKQKQKNNMPLKAAQNTVSCENSNIWHTGLTWKILVFHHKMQ